MLPIHRFAQAVSVLLLVGSTTALAGAVRFPEASIPVGPNFAAVVSAANAGAEKTASSGPSAAGIMSRTTVSQLYVDVLTGSNANAGTIDAPLATITAALAHAVAGDEILVSKGVYAEQVFVTVPVSLYGQYDQSRGWIREASNITTINGVAIAESGPVVFSAVNGAARLDGFEVHAANATIGNSSYAVRIIDSPGPIQITHNTLVAGSGGVGVAGSAGASDGDGGDGGNGQLGSCDSQVSATGGVHGSSMCGANGGDAGAGGYKNQSGMSGMGGSGGTSGGTGGSSGSFPAHGSVGGSGDTGSSGASGANAAASLNLVGNIFASNYVPVVTPAGSPGGKGQGGGGGGGGGGVASFGSFGSNGTGNGGGGGGAGGCGATGSSSGGGGGGAFGVFVNNSSASVDANYLVINAAGTGGSGGNAAVGGVAGDPGVGGNACTSNVGAGGSGGSGGNGGTGGAGAGGPGGPALGIFASASASLTLGVNRSSLPGSAVGGLGGSGGGVSGNNGIARRAYPTDVSEPGPATLIAHDGSILMPYSGINFISIPITLAPITQENVQVHFQTSNGSAIAGTHYLATSGDLVFEPWQTQQSIRIQIIGQPVSAKSFNVQLSSADNASIGVPNAIVTINYAADVIYRNSFD